MAGDYISREAALTALQDSDLFNTTERQLRAIRELPATDVAEVVRCKDCKNLVNTTINANCFLIYDISDMEIAPEDFCSHGERREE